MQVMPVIRRTRLDDEFFVVDSRHNSLSCALRVTGKSTRLTIPIFRTPCSIFDVHITKCALGVLVLTEA